MITSLILSLLACNVELESPTPDSTDSYSGDIIFQVSGSPQASAVALASGSPITHVGLIVVEGDKVTVIEAVEPVREIPIEQFIDHGWSSRVVRYARAMKGKHYDSLFQWNDDRIYCSELVWKAFSKGAGIELTEPQHLGDLNLSLPPVQALIKKRMGGKSPNLNEKIVTPAGLHKSEKLEMVMGFI